MDESMHVQPLSYWLDQISKMEIDTLSKLKRELSAELLRRQLKTLSTKDITKLLRTTSKRIAHLSVDDTEVDIGDCDDIVD